MQMSNAQNRRVLFSGAVLTGLMIIAAPRPSSAVELRQKWVTGQQLNYEMTLAGTLNLQLPADTPGPMMLGGLPLDVEMKATGETVLETLSVDAAGTGTVVMRVPNLKVNALTFGQQAEFTVQDGRTTLLFNGQVANAGRGADAKQMREPEFALRITDRGRLKDIVSLKTAEPAAEKPAPKTPAMFDTRRFFQSMFFRALPSLWPSNDIQSGETWTAPVTWPMNATLDTGDTLSAADKADPNAAANADKTPLTEVGKFDFKLLGEEEIGGRKVQRVALDGAIVIDEKKAAMLEAQRQAAIKAGAAAKIEGETSAAKAARERPRLSTATQKVKGDLWFDVAAGYIVRAELNLVSQAATRALTPEQAAAPIDKKTPPDSWLDFTGTMQFQLKNVSQASAVAPATAAPVVVAPTAVAPTAVAPTAVAPAAVAPAAMNN